MGLYAIGDLHLHFGSVLKAQGQLHGRLWQNHEETLRRNCQRCIRPQDTLVLVGDHSWGRNMDECAPDFAYIEALPGRKILTRGNHDMFWDAKKTLRLNEQFAGRLLFLQGGYAVYEDYALVATKGYTFEGPFYVDARRRIVGWDREAEQKAARLVEREAQRLREGLEAARQAGYRKLIVFLHYPPTSVLETESVFTRLAGEYGAEQVIYAHCHGETRFHDSLEGVRNGVCYRLASGDYLRWQPIRVL